MQHPNVLKRFAHYRNQARPQDGFMERFFGNFKPELGNLTKYKDVAQLYEAIALTVHYYNHDRIQTALQMSPAAYAASLIPAPLGLERASGKVVA